MSIETNILFPVARVVFLVIAVACFLAGGVGLFVSLSSTFLSEASAKRIPPEQILSTVQPFAAASPTGGGKESPFSVAVPKTDELRQRYPNTDVSRVFAMLAEDPSLDKQSAFELLVDALDEAESEDDDVRSYLDNARQVLEARGVNPALRGKAFATYHRTRMAQVRQARQVQAARAQERNMALFGSGVLLVIALQASLILAVLAIERNTRRYPLS